MLGKIYTFTSLRSQPVDMQVELITSYYYLINTDCIIDMVDESALPTVTTNIRYKFNVYDDQVAPFDFKCGNTVAAIRTLDDATKASERITLTVYKDIQTFDKIAYATSETTYFNVDDIVWGENDPTNNYARIWVVSGGNRVTPYIVAQNIDKIVDLADTGTTTTTSTSTSSTSTSSTSTSSTSTSSSSTSSTSTSSTSTSSTSTSSSSTSTTIA